MELLELIAKDTELKETGNFYTGRCPVHNDENPSFICSETGFKCFSCGASGKSAVTYIMLSRKLSLDQAKEYLQKEENNPTKRTYVRKKRTELPVEYLMPCTGYEKPSFEHYTHGKPSKIWKFRDYEGNLVGFTCRFETEDGKVVLPYNYVSVNDCMPEWKWKGFKKPSVLYNCHLLKRYPDRRIIIVEGEKTADAVMENMKGVIALTWVGGSNAINTVDFSPVYGREITLWPDNDLDSKDNNKVVKPYLEQPGNKAMVDIGNLLLRKCPKIMWVKNPLTFRHKFDAADRKWRQGEMKYFIQQNSISFFDLK